MPLKTNNDLFLGAAEGSDFSDDGKRISKKSKNKKNKKSKDRDRSRSMEPISPPPTKKRKSDKTEKTSAGSLSPVSEEENYNANQSKVKKVQIFVFYIGFMHQIFYYLSLNFFSTIRFHFSRKRETKNKSHIKKKTLHLKILTVYHHHLLLHLIRRLEDKVKSRPPEEPLQQRKANFQRMNWNRNGFDC